MVPLISISCPNVPRCAHDIFVNRALALNFGLLVILIASSPVLAIGPGWLGPQLLILIVALMLQLLPSAPEADVQRSLAIFKPLTASALLPALWMLLQIVPVPPGSIGHPIWRSASTALSQPLSGHISIDLGYTLRALFGYLSLASLTFITTVLTRSRERAETLLFGFCAITTFIAIELILLSDFPALKFFSRSTDPLLALAAFGVILHLAFIVRAIERHETRSSSRSSRNHIGMMLAGVTGAIICLIALVLSATSDTLIAVGFGLVVPCLVVSIRRLNLRRWTAATVCASVLVACLGVVALRFAANPSVSPLFRFVKFDSADASAAALRMMSGSNWFGAGVGNYQALAAIYRDATGAPGQTAINTVLSVILEWGYIGLLLVVVLLLQLIAMMFRGALSRGRDSFYAASADGCLVTAFCQALCDASFTDLAVQMMTAIIVGLGLSQSIGRHFT
jgi:hypothetical protein